MALFRVTKQHNILSLILPLSFAVQRQDQTCHPNSSDGKRTEASLGFGERREAHYALRGDQGTNL